MLAHNQSELLNAANLARALAIDNKTVARYLDLLVDLLLVRRLQVNGSNGASRNQDLASEAALAASGAKLRSAMAAFVEAALPRLIRPMMPCRIAAKRNMLNTM
jgi:predicted AAA+ superfamily ATPase